MRGICSICQKEFKITKNNRLYKHGYKCKIIKKSWNGLFVEMKSIRIITAPACIGSGRKINEV